MVAPNPQSQRYPSLKKMDMTMKERFLRGGDEQRRGNDRRWEERVVKMHCKHP